MKHTNWQFDIIFAGKFAMVTLEGHTAARSLELANHAWDQGIDLVEVSVQSDRDVDALSAVARGARRRGKLVGAGSVLCGAQANSALAAGAAYATSPGTHDDVVEECGAIGLPLLPGVATASDVSAARRMGFTWVRAFPASSLGADWFATITKSFPAMSFVAAGGIDAVNASSFIESGARVAAVAPADVSGVAHIQARARRTAAPSPW
ncbi:MAG: bifunctional 4-hydroxy-2-oxoglutarate aldolase/2-dehydro-3-deoxy-phosphogluconate aldolase [Rhodoglobus sp.]